MARSSSRRSAPPRRSSASPVTTSPCAWQETARLASVAETDRDALGVELGACIEEYRRLWLERFRPGGLSDSTAWFDHLLDCYRTGQAERSWFGPFG